MAVLGAKRPQDRGWQWVVLSLWIVLVWPAAQAALMPSGVRVELFIAWRLFLWGLIAVGMLNYLPTKYWRAALLVATGQVVLLRDFLWPDDPVADGWSYAVGVGCLLSAAVLQPSDDKASTTNHKSKSTTLDDLNALWIDYRNNYGSFWALRLLGRINQSAQQRNWPFQLHWSGFVSQAEQQPTAEQLAELEQALDSVLRRFVEIDEGQ